MIIPKPLRCVARRSLESTASTKILDASACRTWEISPAENLLGESRGERVFCYSKTYFLNQLEYDFGPLSFVLWLLFRIMQKLVANYWTLAVKCRRTCCIWGGPLGLKLWRWLCLAAPKAQCRVCHLPLTNRHRASPLRTNRTTNKYFETLILKLWAQNSWCPMDIFECFLDKPELDWNRHSQAKPSHLDTWLLAAISGGSLWILWPFDWTVRQDLGGQLWSPFGFRGAGARRHPITLAAFVSHGLQSLQYRFATDLQCSFIWAVVDILIEDW